MMNDYAQQLCHFLDSSPTVYHCAKQIKERLQLSGFSELKEDQRWSLEAGKGYYVCRNESSIIAFILGSQPVEQTSLLLGLSHGDSPGFRLKNHSASVEEGALWIGLQTYGGPIFSTWLDRDLALAGRLLSYDNGQWQQRLVDSKKAVALIPNLAIHLHQQLNKGFEYNAQQHMRAYLGMRHEELAEDEKFPRELVEFFDIKENESAELFLYDHQKAQLFDNGLIASQRVDNLAMTHALISAFERYAKEKQVPDSTLIACVVDSEEIGNLTYQGGASDFIPRNIEHLLLSRGGSREDFLCACARSFLISLDASNAINPMYADNYDSSYPVHFGKGPALKLSNGVSYTSSILTMRRMQDLAAKYNIPLQYSVARSDQRTGRTVGPPVSSALGIPAVDLGVPQWAMHSIREMVSAADVESSVELLYRFFSDK